MNLTMLLEMVAEGAPDRQAVGPTGAGPTYRELLAASARLGGLLRSEGAARVAQLGVNDHAVPTLLFGAAHAGAPYASLNYRLADDRLRTLLERITPATVMADDACRARVEGTAGATVASPAELLERAADTPPAAPDPSTDPEGDSVAVTLFTSGTSGEPKEVVLRHRVLVSYVLGTVEFLGADEDEAALVSVPAYHIAGVAAVLTNLYLGRRLVYLPQFDAREWVETAARERITHAMIVPTMLGRVLDVLAETGTELPALRALSYGGGRMPLPVIERALELLPHVEFVNAYGLTETSSTIALLGPDDHRTAAGSVDPEVRARLGSVGRSVPGIEIEIRDPEGAAVPPGVGGEIHVRGAQVAAEYRTGDVRDAEGWFATHDSGRLDAEGYLFVEGRTDDVIVRGGENLSPGEIEDVLRRHPAVADVAVLGLPDPEWGETPAAAVVLHEGSAADADELRSWVRDRLRSSWTPSLVVERSDLPYSETGKLLRRVLRGELSG